MLDTFQTHNSRLLSLEHKQKHKQELQLLGDRVLLTTNAQLSLSITTLVGLIPLSIACHLLFLRSAFQTQHDWHQQLCPGCQS